ncbi:helical backbone metal receptor [Streptomyces sp. NPDC002588]|uniref:helical backbone metal receptor n=1 Tax=Streptomyces sp. NPDC002588 TaxID=3154419 RepID=UPI00331A3BA7
MGTLVTVPRPVRRVVSLVPSLTEALARSVSGLLVGATDWCTHPPDLDVVRVRGTKNPNLGTIRELRPDLVLANKEENRELDVRRLRDSGIAVWVTVIETVPQGLASLERIFTAALGRPVPEWLITARALWGAPPQDPVVDVAIPIWRDPWMVVGSSTFTGDLVRRAGLRNVFAGHPQRYPHIDVDRIDGSGADVVLLPDEPYLFTAEDGPEAFAHTPTELVNGRMLTWYGPSLIEAHQMLRDLRRIHSGSIDRGI